MFLDDGRYVVYVDDYGVERCDADGNLVYCDGVYVEVFLDEAHAIEGCEPVDSFCLALGYELDSMCEEEIERSILDAISQ